MLKITVLEDPEIIAIKLEGRLGGPWATELDRTWRGLCPSLGTKRVSVDLCGMTWADQDGKRLLHEIYEKSGAAFVANTPLSKYFAAEAMRVGGMEREN
jgi:hypothetical protein